MNRYKMELIVAAGVCDPPLMVRRISIDTFLVRAEEFDAFQRWLEDAYIEYSIIPGWLWRRFGVDWFRKECGR